ncbi:hypothetical protein AB0W38_04345 [Aliarcobacter butzleri]|uniref:hypothetical protein n=1 Tax=Aliarcobacter butzleri TaxID=28197 RepID=UPI00344B8EFA
MKKFFIFLFFVSVLNADLVTEEQASKNGQGLSVAVNMNPNITGYKEKLILCNDLANSSAILGADNRKEMLPIVIKACQDNIKK